jgi:PhnB protein
MVNPIPEGYPRVSPYLVVDGADAAITFYREVFGANERMRMGGPDGKIGHAEIDIGDSLVMLADPFPDMGATPPQTPGEGGVAINVYVENVDDVFQKALARGSTSVREPQNEFYGDRMAAFDDPFGHRWNVMTHVEDVPPDEMEKRMAQMTQQGGAG